MDNRKTSAPNNISNQERLAELVERTKRIVARIHSLQTTDGRLTIKTPSKNDLFSKAPRRRFDGF